MTYVFVEDFRGGMDRRKSRVSGVPGTIWTLFDGHITRGGEVIKRKAFVDTYTLPASVTFGLFSAGNILYSFGGAAEPGGMPEDVTYQRLQHPDGSTAMSRLVYATVFDG